MNMQLSIINYHVLTYFSIPDQDTDSSKEPRRKLEGRIEGRKKKNEIIYGDNS